MTDPYYADDQVSLYLGDCREVLPALPEQPTSCVTDPPYEETSAGWDTWPDGWVHAVEQVLPASASLWCFGSARMFLQHAAEFAAWRFGQEALWVKRNGSGPGSKDRLARVHEWAYHWYRGRWSALHHEWELERTTANRGTARKAAPAAAHQQTRRASAWQDDGTRQPRSVTYVIEAPSVRHRGRHQAEKPIAVLAPLVRECTPPGGLVLDPMAGSGSTLEAAVLCGRRAVGIERDEQSAERAAKRLSAQVLDLGELPS